MNIDLIHEIPTHKQELENNKDAEEVKKYSAKFWEWGTNVSLYM